MLIYILQQGLNTFSESASLRKLPNALDHDQSECRTHSIIRNSHFCGRHAFRYKSKALIKMFMKSTVNNEYSARVWTKKLNYQIGFIVVGVLKPQ